MIVNLVVIFLILFIGVVFGETLKHSADSYSSRKVYIGLICFILILQSGLRNVAVGEDTFNYFNWFEETKDISWSRLFQDISDYYKYGIGKDVGYPLLMKTFQIFSSNFQVYLLFIALFFFSALGNFILKNTNRFIDVVFAFVIYSVLFYSFYSITGIRQTIATTFSLFSYEYLKRKKLIPFLILLFLGASIHKSILIFLPFYFVVRMKNLNYFYYFVLLLFPIIMINRSLIANLLKIIGGYDEYEQYEGAGTFTFTLMFVSIFLFALLRRKTLIKQNSNVKNYFTAFAITLLFLPLSWINPSALRVVMYFTIFMIVFVPEIVFTFQEISTKFRFYLSVFAITMLILLFVKANWNNTLGYGFFWQDMELPYNY